MGVRCTYDLGEIGNYNFFFGAKIVDRNMKKIGDFGLSALGEDDHIQ